MCKIMHFEMEYQSLSCLCRLCQLECHLSCVTMSPILHSHSLLVLICTTHISQWSPLPQTQAIFVCTWSHLPKFSLYLHITCLCCFSPPYIHFDFLCHSCFYSLSSLFFSFLSILFFLFSLFLLCLFHLWLLQATLRILIFSSCFSSLDSFIFQVNCFSLDSIQLFLVPLLSFFIVLV